MNPYIGKKKKEEIKEEDFKAYLASSSDEEECMCLLLKVFVASNHCLCCQLNKRNISILYYKYNV